jgi:hypothetical protein
VPFQYSAIADKWENITATQLALRPDEVLVVNATYRFSSLFDESVMVINPRQITEQDPKHESKGKCQSPKG